MKRWTLLFLALGVLVTTASQVWAQRRDDDEDRIRFYVIAEKRGLDIVCAKVTSMVQVNERTTELKREQVETAKANFALKKEIDALKKRITGLKQLKGRKRTEEEKEEVQKQIDQVEQEVQDKESQIKPVVQFQVSRAFSKSEDADALIDQYEREARLAREAAERKR